MHIIYEHRNVFICVYICNMIHARYVFTIYKSEDPYMLPGQPAAPPAPEGEQAPFMISWEETARIDTKYGDMLGYCILHIIYIYTYNIYIHIYIMRY